MSGHRVPRSSGSSPRVVGIEDMVITSNEDVPTVISCQKVGPLYTEQNQPEDTTMKCQHIAR